MAQRGVGPFLQQSISHSVHNPLETSNPPSARYINPSLLSDAEAEGIYVPPDTDKSYANVWDMWKAADVPLFWHAAPRNGDGDVDGSSAFIQEVLGECFGKVVASDAVEGGHQDKVCRNPFHIIRSMG